MWLQQRVLEVWTGAFVLRCDVNVATTESTGSVDRCLCLEVRRECGNNREYWKCGQVPLS